MWGALQRAEGFSPTILRARGKAAITALVCSRAEGPPQAESPPHIPRELLIDAVFPPGLRLQRRAALVPARPLARVHLPVRGLQRHMQRLVAALCRTPTEVYVQSG